MIRRRFVYPTLALAAAVGAAVVLIPRPGVAGEDLKAAFTAQDANHDGFLTAQELQPPPEGFSLPSRPVVIPANAVRVTGPRVVRVGPPRPWAEVAQQLIDDRDQDGDHRLNLAEYRAFRITSAQQTFVTRDANHDGRLSRDEFINPPPGLKIGTPEFQARRRAALSPVFDRLDADHDGFLSAAEHTPD